MTAALLGAVALVSVQRTAGLPIHGGERPPLMAVADLGDLRLTERPAGWMPFHTWLRDHRIAGGAEANGRWGDPTHEPAIPTAEEISRYRLWVEGFGAPDLSGRDLRGARMARIFAPGLPLGGARLTEASLSGADLERAFLSGAALDRATLTGARLNGADLSTSILDGANLGNAALDGADLTRAGLDGATLTDASLNGATLNFARMNGAILKGADLIEAQLGSAKLNGAALNTARLNRAVLTGAELHGADIRDAVLEDATLLGVRMNGARLHAAHLKGATLDSARLLGADLWMARLGGARLRGTMIVGSSLSQARLSDADCTGTAFVGVIADSADLGCEGGAPSQEQLDLVVGDDATILPDGLDVWSCLDRTAAPVRSSRGHRRGTCILAGGGVAGLTRRLRAETVLRRRREAPPGRHPPRSRRGARRGALVRQRPERPSARCRICRADPRSPVPQGTWGDGPPDRRAVNPALARMAFTNPLIRRASAR